MQYQNASFLVMKVCCCLITGSAAKIAVRIIANINLKNAVFFFSYAFHEP